MRDAIALVTFLLGLAVSAPAVRAQEFEPNNTCAQANLVSSGTYYGQTMHVWHFPDLEGWDYDFFRIPVPAGASVTITTWAYNLWEPGELRHYMYLNGCGGTANGPWATSSGPYSITFVNTTSSTSDFYLLLYAWSYELPDWMMMLDYQLQIEIVPDACVSGVEDRFETGPGGPAVPIAPGLHTGLFTRPDNDDVYSLRLAQGTSIAVRIDFDQSAGDLDLEVSDGTHTTVSNGTTGVEFVDFTTTLPIGADLTRIRVLPKPGPGATCNTYDLRIDVLQTPIGTSYCQAGVNGYTTEARILAAGSSSVSANLLMLWCQAFPGANPGILIASPTQAQVPFGDGFRCVGGGILRLAASSAVDHVAVYTPNFTSGQGTAITPGTTWNFQAFYRDTTLPGGTGFNLTDGVSIAMTP